MKKTLYILLAAILAAFGCSPGSAQMIYSNNFALGGAVNLAGTAPTVATNFAGGSSSATWNDVLGVNDTGSLSANGIDASTLGDSWLLPFHPQAGYIYTLTVSLTFTNDPGSGDAWVGAGFAQRDSVNVPYGDGRFADAANGGPNGYDWILFTESTGSVQYFSGPKGSIPQIYAGNPIPIGPQTLASQVILDTEGSRWTITAYVNGVQMGNTYTYTNSSPPIGAVGLTQNALTAPGSVQWNYLALQVAGTGLTNIVVSPVNPAIGVGSNEQFTATGYFSSGPAQTLTGNLDWVVDNSLIATVNSNGLATGLTGGTATITAISGGISNSTTLTVVVPPAISVQPTNNTVSPNGSVTLNVSATGGDLSYQWQLNGTNIAGANGASFTITNVSGTNVGVYTVIISNLEGSVTSQGAIVGTIGIQMFAGVIVNGPLGSNYLIQAASGLPGGWTTLTNVALPSQPYIYIDYSSPTNPRQFYRAVPQ
jgi:hypothetical protein